MSASSVKWGHRKMLQKSSVDFTCLSLLILVGTVHLYAEINEYKELALCYVNGYFMSEPSYGELYDPHTHPCKYCTKLTLFQ